MTSAKDELYGYDRLNRLTEFRRGTLTGTDTIANVDTTQRQTFTLDPVGNWTGNWTGK